jgi:hypothetical protein
MLSIGDFARMTFLSVKRATVESLRLLLDEDAPHAIAVELLEEEHGEIVALIPVESAEHLTEICWPVFQTTAT